MVAMRLVRTQTMARVAAASLLVCSGGCVVWAVVAPVQAPRSSPARIERPTQEEPGARDAPDGGARWEVLSARRFQQALYDPPPQLPPPVVEKPPAPPPVRLLATMAEPGGGGHAMILDDKGVTRVVPVGATVTAGGASVKVLAVRRDSIDLQQEDRVVTVELKAN